MFGSTRREHAQLQRACVVLDPNSQQPVSTVSGGSASSPRLRALHVLVPADPLSLPSAVLRSPPRLPPHAASTPAGRDNQGPAAPASPPPQAAEEALCSRRGAPTPAQPHPVPSPQHFPAPRPWRFHCPGGLVVSAARNLRSPRMSSPLPQSSRSGSLKEGSFFAAPSLFPPGDHSPK